MRASTEAVESGSDAAGAFRPPLGDGPMKVGVTFLYTIFKHGYPPKVDDEMEVLDEIADMGFHFLELEGLGDEHLDAVMRRRAEYRRRLDGRGLHVHNFCTVNRDLVHPDGSRRRRAYDSFRTGAQLAEYFGAETLHLASYAPPVEYESGVPYGGSTYVFQREIRARVPDGFDWSQHWDVLVESVAACADIAAGYGRIVIMEPRVGEMIASSDSMLRLIEQAGRPNLFANFDTGHFHAQRETIPLTLEKLEGRYANVHLADNDQLSTEHLPLGEGTVDWPQFFLGLKRHRYSGYMGLDLGGEGTIARDLVRSWEFVARLAEELDFEVVR